MSYKPGPRQAEAEYPLTDNVKRAEPNPDIEFVPVEGYGELSRVLISAYNQASRGKGKQRHADDKPLMDQPIIAIPVLLGGTEGLGGLSYQIIKKSHESIGLTNRRQFTAAKREFLDVIVYAAAAYLHLERLAEAHADDCTD